MALVGDVILGFREQATDLPQGQSPPYINSISPIPSSAGGFGPATVYLVATTIGPWGETIATVESSIVLTGTLSTILVNLNIFPNSTAVRIYYSINVSGSEELYEEFPVTTQAGVQTVSVNVLNVGLNGVPPSRVTAYNPDTDGPAIGAYAAYRWLNQALTWAASKNKGGLPSFGAVNTVVGQPLYIIPGYWKKIDTAWYDGYPLYPARKNDVFRKSPVPGTGAALIVHEATDRLIVEAWPQPGRTSAQTTLTSALTAVSTSAPIASSGGWVLGFGKAMIDQEMVEYSSVSSNTLTNLTRGLAGTTAVAHNSGAPVLELNLEISGMRLPTSYKVGAALSTLQTPPGWENVLMRYMLYCFRSAEQDDAGATRYLKEATDMINDLSANRIILGPRQVSISAGRGAETYPGLGGVFGGVIVP